MLGGVGGNAYEIVDSEPFVQPLPDHIVGFRQNYCPDPTEKPAVVMEVWRILLPGAAQMWYRVHVKWRRHWPYKLLQLLVPGLSFDDRAQVARDLLRAMPCCFGQGGSLAQELRSLALDLYDDDAKRVEFILGPWCAHVIKAWASAISISIMDLECNNNRIKSRMPTGRAHNMATLAAKELIASTTENFYSVKSKWPQTTFQEHTAIAVNALQNATAKKKRTRARSGWDVFLEDYYGHRRALQTGGRGSPSTISKRYNALDEGMNISDAWAALSEDAKTAYQHLADIENAPRAKQEGDNARALTDVSSNSPQNGPPSSQIVPYLHDVHNAIVPFRGPQCYEPESVLGRF